MREIDPSSKKDVSHVMSLREAMDEVGRQAVERQRQLAQQWADFYEACTVSDIGYYLSDYLDQFDFFGTQTRLIYDLDFSICLAEGLHHARSREPNDMRMDEIAAALDNYNEAVREHRGHVNSSYLGETRLALATAMLSLA